MSTSTVATPPRSSSPHHTPEDSSPPIPTATLALPSTAPTTRRLPPPCWSPEETLALIQTYRDKWYSLRRGNLKANHWQEVADEIATKCPIATPKTAVQCRHKMEKLRKRYRAEIQRAANHGGLRGYNSPWVHFNFIHEMEKGPEINKISNPPPTPPSSSSDDEDEDDENDRRNSVKRINHLYNFSANRVNNKHTAPTGVRIKIPGRANPSPPANQFDGMNQSPNFYPHRPYATNPNFNPGQSRFGTFGAAGVNGAGNSSKTSEKGFSIGEVPKRRKVVNGGGMNDIVAAVQAMGEGFMRIEKDKMDMFRRVEEMRMDMELKRMEMVLESQQRIVEAFAKAVAERNRKKDKTTTATMNHSNQ